MRRLRPYQERGKHDIFQAWETDDILFFQLTTGGGKTVIFTDVIMHFLLQGKRVLMVAHREELIAQAWRTLFDARIYAGVIQSDLSHLAHGGKLHPVKNPDLPAQVCSIQTVARRRILPAADLIVIDEGHHTTEDNSYGKLLKRYPGAKVLIVSATPYRLSGEGFRNICPGKVTRLIRNSSLAELQADGWLVPLRYFISYIPDLTGVDHTQGEYNTEQTYERMKLAPIVDSWEKDAKGKQGLCFAVNVRHSIDIVQQYWARGIPSEHVDANTPDDKRQQIITDFKAGLVKVVSNVGIFTEGTDFPNCEFVQLARPTESLSLYLQMVGRGTRPVGGLVDQYLTAMERCRAIAASAKPNCIVLDNAGLGLKHFLPEHPHDWEMHFNGTRDENGRKKKPVEDELEMLVYVAEDTNGKRVRTNKIKEIEGMQLIEVTSETRKKIITVTSIREFDRLLLINRSQYSIKQPGYKTVTQYIATCEKQGILMLAEHWDYIKLKLITEPQNKLEGLARNRSANAAAYPNSIYAKATSDVMSIAVDEPWLIEKKREYTRRNQDRIKAYNLREYQSKFPTA